jgi:creatinine amidohydrolase
MIPATFQPSCLRLAALGLAAYALALAPLQAQVRKLHTRDYIRLSQVQVMEYLKRSDVMFIPVGAVETNGISPSDRDYVTPLAYAMAMAEEVDALYMPGLMWSYPGTTLVASATINISPSQGVSFLKAMSESLIRSGFRRLVFISAGHGPAPLTIGTVVRELFDEFRVPAMYIEMGEKVSKLNLPAPQRNRIMYGAHQITGRLIDLPIKGDYGENPMGIAGPIPENPGYAALGELGYQGSLALGSWVADLRSHGGGNQALPASEAEREEWGKQGEAQIRAIVKQLKLREAMDSLKKHDEFTNQVLVPKFQKILPPLP